MHGGTEIPCQLTFVGKGRELKKVHCNFARDASLKVAATKAASVTVAEVTKEGSSSNEILSKSEQCIVKKEPIDNTSTAIDLKKDGFDAGTTTSTVIDLRKDSCDTDTTSSVANDLRKHSCDADITTTADITNDVWITHGNHTLKFQIKQKLSKMKK